MPDLVALAADAVSCTRCALAEGRTQVVFGTGDPDAGLLFVGEGPGAEEDRQGLPFVGRSGKLLDRLVLEEMGRTRAECYIANVVKCRPPGNRDPEADEIAACSVYLDGQERALQPAVVVSLGRHSLQRYLPGARIGAVHGRLRRSYSGQHVFPMYHPAAALHQASLRETLFRDIRGLPAALLAAREALGSGAQRSVEAEVAPARASEPDRNADDTEQLTFF